MKTPKLKPLASAFGALLLSALSAFALPTVTVPTDPQTPEVTDGKPITLSVTASTDVLEGVLAYEWFKDGNPIVAGQLPGVTGFSTNTLKISKAVKAHAGVYHCRVFEPGPQPILEDLSETFTLTVNVRPVIAKVNGNPAPTTKTQEQEASFSVALDPNTTTTNLVIQWQKNNVDIDPIANPSAIAIGTLNSTFTIPAADAGPPATPGVQVTDAGNYRAKIVSPLTATTIYSKAAALKVNSAPVVLKHPAADTGGVLYIAAKASGKLGVTVGGNSPFKYQWKKQDGLGDVDVANAKASSVSLKGDNAVEGLYRVEITNPYTKSATLPSGKDPTLSNYAQVVVLNKVTDNRIAVNSNNTPNDKGEYPAGSTFTLTVNPSDTDTGVLEYQWQKDGKNIADNATAPNIVSGTNTATLVLNPLHWVHRGVYRCVVKNKVGVLTTKTFTLKVDSPPVLLTPPPAEVLAALGGSATFSLVAGGNVPLKYQWYRVGNPVAIKGGTAAKLTVSCKEESAEGTYYCVITNKALGVDQTLSTEVSNPVFLRVDAPVKIGLQPQSGSVTTGNPLTLSVETSQGDPSITFQWQKNGKDLVDGNGFINTRVVVDTLTNNKARAELVVPVDATTAGSYRCVVSNVGGKVKVTSATAKVTALLTPFISQQPEDKTIFKYGSTTLTVKAGGTPTLKYQWEFKSASAANFVTLVGKTSATLSLSNVQFNQAGEYRCTVSNATTHVAVSDAAEVVVNPIPFLTIDEITPKIARAGDKVRITGDNVKQFIKSVKIGGAAGVNAPFVKETGDSILFTVPATAPVSATSITLINIDDGSKTSEAPNQFQRSTVQANDRRNPSIIVGATFPPIEGATTTGVLFDNTLPATGFAEAVYEWVAPKAGTYYVLGTSIDLTFQIFLDVTTSEDDFPLNYFPSTSQAQNLVIAQPNTLVRFRVYGQVPYGALGQQGLIDFGNYRLTCDFLYGPIITSNFAGSEGTPVAGQEGWSQEGSSATAKLVQVSEYDQAASFTGSSSKGVEPTVLWKDASDVEAGPSDIVHTEWTMGIDQAGTGTGGYYGWQVTGADGSPLAQLQFSVADGSVSLVQPDGTRTEAEPQLVPGSTHRFEIITDLGAATWQARMDGAVLGEPLPLPAKSGFGDVSAIWFPSATGGAQPTMTFDDVTITVD